MGDKKEKKQGAGPAVSGKRKGAGAKAFVRSRSPFSEPGARSRRECPLPPPPDLFPRIPHKGEYTEETADRRIAWLEEQTGQKPSRILRPALSPEDVRGSIETFIGTVQIPVGLAGPLWIRGDFASGWFFAPPGGPGVFPGRRRAHAHHLEEDGPRAPVQVPGPGRRRGLHRMAAPARRGAEEAGGQATSWTAR